MTKLFTFDVLGVEKSIEANDQCHARELILLEMCGVDVSDGYWDAAVDNVINETELGRIVWEDIKRKNAIKTEEPKRRYHAEVEVLEWNTYKVEMLAESEEEAKENIQWLGTSGNFNTSHLVDKVVEVKTATSMYGGRDPIIKDFY